MTRERAIKIIKDALSKTMRDLAFGATLFEHGIDEPWTRRDYDKREKIRQALQVLKEDQPIQLKLEV